MAVMLKSRSSLNRLSPWIWVPTLYFAEGIPYFVVNAISVIMFNRMGVPNGEMSLFTSLLYLPWVIKPLWSPFVDIIRTKRWWITAMQLVISLCFIFVALTLPDSAAVSAAASAADISAVETSAGPVSATVPISLFSFTLILFWITAFASATNDIASDGFYMLALSDSQQSFFVGVRSTFYRLATVFGQGVLVVIAGILETRTVNIPRAWFLTMLFTAILFAAVSFWHLFFLPRPERPSSENIQAGQSEKQGREEQPVESRKRSAKDIIKEFGRTFATFFTKKHVAIALIFMLLYRLPEAFLVKMLNPFLLAPAADGGLGLTTAQVGIVYGTAGIIALTAGGILGGMAVSKWGLKRCLWPMALSLALPSLAFIGLSIWQPESIWVTSTFICIDQFGYGFGFTAYMLYMIYFSRGEYKTAHYSLCTAFMALSMMIPGLVAGYLQESLGYTGFFIMVGLCCLVTVGVTFLLEIEDGYGRKN